MRFWCGFGLFWSTFHAKGNWINLHYDLGMISLVIWCFFHLSICGYYRLDLWWLELIRVFLICILELVLHEDDLWVFWAWIWVCGRPGKLFCRSWLVMIDHKIRTIDRVLDGGSAIDRLYNDDRSVLKYDRSSIVSIDRGLGQIVSYWPCVAFILFSCLIIEVLEFWKWIMKFEKTGGWL